MHMLYYACCAGGTRNTNEVCSLRLRTAFTGNCALPLSFCKMKHDDVHCATCLCGTLVVLLCCLPSTYSCRCGCSTRCSFVYALFRIHS